MITLNLLQTIVICAVVLLLLYISFIQYRRADKATEAADILASNLNTISEYIREATEKMNNPRLKQAFESDDEVGFFFKELQNIQETLTNFTSQDEETSTDVE